MAEVDKETEKTFIEAIASLPPVRKKGAPGEKEGWDHISIHPSDLLYTTPAGVTFRASNLEVRASREADGATAFISWVRRTINGHTKDTVRAGMVAENNQTLVLTGFMDGSAEYFTGTISSGPVHATDNLSISAGMVDTDSFHWESPWSVRTGGLMESCRRALKHVSEIAQDGAQVQGVKVPQERKARR